MLTAQILTENLPTFVSVWIWRYP